MSNRTCSPVSRLIDSIRMQSRRNHNIKFCVPICFVLLLASLDKMNEKKKTIKFKPN